METMGEKNVLWLELVSSVLDGRFIEVFPSFEGVWGGQPELTGP